MRKNKTGCVILIEHNIIDFYFLIAISLAKKKKNVILFLTKISSNITVKHNINMLNKTC